MTELTGPPADVLARLWDTLGYVAKESLVVVSIKPRNVWGMVLRTDLVDCLVEEVAGPLSRTIASHLRADGARGALIVGVGSDADLTERATTLVRNALGTYLDWITTLRVVDGEIHTPTDHCPPSPHSSVTLEHRCAQTRAEQNVASAAERTKVSRAGERWRRRRRGDNKQWRIDSWDIWERALGAAKHGVLPSPAVVGKLVAGIEDIVVRDAVVVAMTSGGDSVARELVRGEGDDAVAQALSSMTDRVRGVEPQRGMAQAYLDLGSHIAARVVGSQRAPTLTVLGIMMWWCGATSCAQQLVDEALTWDGTYRLAVLIQGVLAHSIAPGWLVRRREAIWPAAGQVGSVKAT